jgi:hypothetical protein
LLLALPFISTDFESAAAGSSVTLSNHLEVSPAEVIRRLDLDDPQAHRVERVLRVAGCVVLELRPAGLAVSEAVRVTLPVDRIVSRLGTATD